MAMRRHISYTPELADEICERLCNGETIRSICADEHIPARVTVREWVYDDVHGFAAKYKRARDIGLMDMEDELLEIIDDGSNDWMARRARDGSVEMVPNHEHIQRSKLRADKRQWLMSQRSPSHYGRRGPDDADTGIHTIVIKNAPDASD